MFLRPSVDSSSLIIIEFMLRVFTNAAIVWSKACRRLFLEKVKFIREQ